MIKVADKQLFAPDCLESDFLLFQMVISHFTITNNFKIIYNNCIAMHKSNRDTEKNLYSLQIELNDRPKKKMILSLA